MSGRHSPVPRGFMPAMLFLLCVGPTATFRFSFAADTRLDVYNAISRGGFFSQAWDVHQSKSKMRVRQVPGDGSCLFHAIYVALAHATNGSHPSDDYNHMCRSAATLRRMALDYLSSNPERVLAVTHNQDMRSQELLEMTSREMGLTPEQYLTRLRDPKEWGGGLEIVALANALERPIFLYELKPVGILFWSRFVFKKMVECGMPKFAAQKCLHILIADCNFPDCMPYFYNKAGNHFLALFPCEDVPGELIDGAVATAQCLRAKEAADSIQERKARGVQTSGGVDTMLTALLKSMPSENEQNVTRMFDQPEEIRQLLQTASLTSDHRDPTI